MRNVRLHPAANEEWYASAEYLENQRPGYGFKLLDDVREAFAEIADAPDRFLVRELGFRRCLTKQFKYQVWFQQRGESIYIIAVHHSSRKPGYWKERVLDEQR